MAVQELEQVLSSSDVGHDVTSVKLLLSKHKVGFFSFLFYFFLKLTRC